MAIGISDQIFRNYDIRGVFGKTLDAGVAYLVGKALGTIVSKNGGSKFVVGHDNRESSPQLSKSFISGLISTGAQVVDTGLSLTPIVHFLTCEEDFDSGVMITASHNPKEYNGFRIDCRNAISFHGEDIQRLKKLVKEKDFVVGDGKLVTQDLSRKYISYIKEQFEFNKKYKIVLDCKSGLIGKFGPEVFGMFGFEVILLHCKSDSAYPYGIPDPENRESLADLVAEVVSQGADIGVMVDPDSDRFGVVDSKGNKYDNDKMLMLFAEDVLKKNPKTTVVYDVKSTGLLEKFVLSHGGVPKMIRTGHPYFVEEVKKGAVLGGEFSGHVYFGDKYFGYDDGIYAILRVIEIMQNTNKSLFDLMCNYPKAAHSPEIKLSCPDEHKFELIDSISNVMLDLPDIVSVNNTDGVRVSVTDTGWFLVRASNTSPVISVRVEGKNEEEADDMVKKVLAVLEPYGFVDVTPLKTVKIYVS